MISILKMEEHMLIILNTQTLLPKDAKFKIPTVCKSQRIQCQYNHNETEK